MTASSPSDPSFFFKPEEIAPSGDGKIYYNPNLDPCPASDNAVNINLQKADIPPKTSNFEHLSPEEVDHFLQHGWLHVPNAVAPEYLEEWPKDLFTRLPGWVEHDKSTWQEEYTQVSRIREAPAMKVIPRAWEKVVELAGGPHMLDVERDSRVDDHFIINFGSEAKAKQSPSAHPPHGLKGWHTDDEWYRQFLDSSGDSMTLLVAWSDIPEGGGGTWIAEDGTKGVCEYLLHNTEGLDVPNRDALVAHIPSCERFHQFTAKKGDVIITHGLLPHRAGINYLHYPRIISNPHVCLSNPHNLNRSDGTYSILEQYILLNLGRDSVPEFKPSSERLLYLPYHAMHEEARAQRETEAMVKVAKERGEDPSKLDCVYFMEEGSPELVAYRRRHGLNLPIKNVANWQGHAL